MINLYLRLYKIIFLFVFSLLISGCNSSSKEIPKLKINVKEQPTIGDSAAPVHMIVFEEPKCPACKKFSTLIFPLIKKEYIDTGKVTYTLMPVSFVPNSMQAAIAWLCVYEQKSSTPEITFKYIDYMYSHQPSEDSDWVTPENLINFAKETSSEIDIDELKNCLKSDHLRTRIEKNTLEGTRIMNGELATPGIYVNGRFVDALSYDAISQVINQNLAKK